MRILNSCLSVCSFRKEITLAEYQTYNSTWYINGKALTCILLHENPRNFLSFSKRSKLNFDLCWSAYVFLQYRSNKSINQQHGNSKNWFSFLEKSKLNFELYFDLCWTAYCFFNIGRAVQSKSKQLQSVNIYILCVFILLSPMLSHIFLLPQVATYSVFRFLIACQQNWEPLKYFFVWTFFWYHVLWIFCLYYAH